MAKFPTSHEVGSFIPGWTLFAHYDSLVQRSSLRSLDIGQNKKITKIRTETRYKNEGSLQLTTTQRSQTNYVRTLIQVISQCLAIQLSTVDLLSPSDESINSACPMAAITKAIFKGQ